MRIFALSDIHADFEPNARWLRNLSLHDYQSDLLILAGDVSDSLSLLGRCLELLARRFQKVLFVPGNHELWTFRDRPRIDSFEKFERVQEVAQNSGGTTDTFRANRLSIVPLLAWYDYSFGSPSSQLSEQWMDFYACAWPPHSDVREITERFLALNAAALNAAALNAAVHDAAVHDAAVHDAAVHDAAVHDAAVHELGEGRRSREARGNAEPRRGARGDAEPRRGARDDAMAGDGAALVDSNDAATRATVITFSHFLPRFELVPKRRAPASLDLSPVLGSVSLDRQVRQAKSTIHVYGHSHVNRRLGVGDVTYVNNAFGYPHEVSIAAKRLLCILDC